MLEDEMIGIKNTLSKSMDECDWYKLGLMFEQENDFENAVIWISNAAERGLSVAQNALGDIYLFEKGVKQDREKAYKWYTRAAQQQCPIAFANLGFLFQYKPWNSEEEKVHNQKRAFDSFKQAAELNNAFAMYKIGNFYDGDYEGLGEWLDKNYETSLFWYKASAQGGYLFAQLKLGMYYFDNLTCKENVEECLKWLFYAAKQKNQTACFTLLDVINNYGVYKTERVEWEHIKYLETFSDLLELFNRLSFKNKAF